jgi:hypothetical protein
VQENRFSNLERVPGHGLDREPRCSQNAQLKALGCDDVQRIEHIVWRSQFSNTARIVNEARLKIRKMRER